MIADTLSNADRYRGLSSRIALALDFLRGTDLGSASGGTVEIEGSRVYALIQEYETLPASQGVWEAHRRYVDLQCVVAGTERIGYGNPARLSPGVYDPARDVLPLSGEGEFLTLGPGDFMLLFPEEAHMPRIAAGEPATVRKVVVKIAIEP